MAMNLEEFLLNNWDKWSFGKRTPHQIKIIAFPASLREATLFLTLDNDLEPSIVIKVCRTSPHSRAHWEHYVLKTIHLSLSHSIKDSVPKPIGFITSNGTDYSLETFMRGLPMSCMTHRSRKSPQAKWTLINFSKAFEWLQVFHQETRSENREIGEKYLQKHIILPVRELRKRLHLRERTYSRLSRLVSRIEALAETTIPLVLAHNQFGPSNILIDKNGKVKVVDWDVAQFHQHPLYDLFVFILEYIIWSTRSKDPQCYTKAVAQAIFTVNSFRDIVIEQLSIYKGNLGIKSDLWLLIKALFLGQMAIWANEEIETERHEVLFNEIISNF